MSVHSAMATDSVDSVFLQLVRVVNLTARPFQEGVGRQHQLSLNEWRVLAVLARLPGLNASAVAEQTGLDKMSVSRALRGLAQRGRLSVQAHTRDQRKRELRLTTEGQGLFNALWPLAQQREATLFADVSADELAQLAQVLEKLEASVRGQR